MVIAITRIIKLNDTINVTHTKATRKHRPTPSQLIVYPQQEAIPRNTASPVAGANITTARRNTGRITKTNRVMKNITDKTFPIYYINTVKKLYFM